MEKINFSYNWNKKLYCQAYTAFRIYNPVKYKVGKVYNIYLKGEFRHKAVILDIKKLRLNQVNEFIAYIDTGYNLEEFKTIVRRMYKQADEKMFCLILLKQITNA